MRSAARLWISAARLRQRWEWRRSAPREELVRRYARGRSFADIGAMWSVSGAIAFLAEAEGASRVTALDLVAPSERYLQEHARRRSNVRFVQGDLHDPEVAREVGEHEVVWCSGVLYHAPHPLQTLTRLRAITTGYLILATETIPEVPGMRGGCVFLPGLPEPDSRVQAAARPGSVALGVSEPYRPEQGYDAWWWGISRSALRGMLEAAGFAIREEHGGPLHATLVAVPQGPPAEALS